MGGPDLAGESNSRFVQLYLAEVERKKNMRQIATDAEKVSKKWAGNPWTVQWNLGHLRDQPFSFVERLSSFRGEFL